MTEMRAATADLLERCKEVLAEYGEQVTVRQLYYRLVAAQVIPNNLKSYKNLVAMLTRWRKEGLLEPDLFVDLTREPHRPQCWCDLPTFLQVVGRSYHRDPWPAQGSRPEVWLEKEALATVFEPVCREYRVTLQVCRGYPSLSCLYQAAGRTERILYFGDFDPSGQDIPRSVTAELGDTWGAEVSLDLIALTPEQIEEYRLPPAPAKATDTRTAAFVAQHGEDTVELDALPPNVLVGMIRAAIEGEIDDDQSWQAEHDEEQREQARLAEIIGGLT